MNILKLKKNADKRIASGHCWIFSNELTEIPRLEPGTIVEIVSQKGESFGKAFYNPNSLIAARLLFHHGEIDKEFFNKRIFAALNQRRQLLPYENSFRLVFGESDFLPGLIVDKFGDYLSLQTISAGMDCRLNMITESLLEVLPETKGIIQKNNSSLRSYEGLPMIEGTIFGIIPENIEITDCGMKVSVSLSAAQKTGYYFDQRYNRLFLRNMSKGKKVLDCFTNLGGFALNAALGGAKFATGVDSSSGAITGAKNNAKLNNINNAEFIESDVIDLLKSENASEKKWDVVVLDPPAFAKSKKTVKAAIGGYANINRLALKIIDNGGYLASASCSQHISEELLFDIISAEAAKQGKMLKLVFRGGQPPDHPILTAMPETQYLKFFVFQVINEI